VSSLAVVFTIVAVLVVKTLVEIYLGGHYVCPSCGAKREDRHAENCSWNHRD